MYKEIKLVDVMVGNEDTVRLYRSIDDEIVKINKCLDYIFINGLEDMHASPRSYIVYRLEEMLAYLKNYNKDVCYEIYKFVKDRDPRAATFYNGILTVTYTTLKSELSTFIKKMNATIKTINYYNMRGTYDLSHCLYEAESIYKISGKDIESIGISTAMTFIYRAYKDFILIHMHEEYFTNPETPDLIVLLKDFLVSYRNLLMDVRSGLSIQIRIPGKNADNKEN